MRIRKRDHETQHLVGKTETCEERLEDETWRKASTKSVKELERTEDHCGFAITIWTDPEGEPQSRQFTKRQSMVSNSLGKPTLPSSQMSSPFALATDNVSDPRRRMAGSLRDGALAGTEAQGMDCHTFVGAASQSSVWTPTSGRSASMPHGAPHALHLVGWRRKRRSSS